MITNSGIYKILNIITGDFYIGSSVNIRKRLNKHCWMLVNNQHDNTHLQNAWNLYGEDNYEFTTILLCDKENLLYYEQVLLDGLKPAYNIARDASAPMRGRVVSVATRLKLSTAMKGKHHTEEARAKMRGRVVSAEARAKISVAQKGNTNCFGRIVLAETRRKISEGHKGELNHNFGRHPSAETRLKLSEAHKGKHPSEEARAKIGATAKKMWVLRRETKASIRTPYD